MSIMDPTGETCDHEWIYDVDITERQCMACGKSQYRGIEHDPRLRGGRLVGRRRFPMSVG